MEWAILVLVGGLLLVVAEVFIPSGGILGILSAGCLVLSVVLAYNQDPPAALIFLAVIIVVLPVMVAVAFHYWPRTPFGKRLFLPEPSAEDIEYHTDRDRELHTLVGQMGRTVTPLRPSGMAEVQGQRVHAMTEGMMVASGEVVRVIAVRGSRLVVRKVDADLSQELDGFDGRPERRATLEPEQEQEDRAETGPLDFPDPFA